MKTFISLASITAVVASSLVFTAGGVQAHHSVYNAQPHDITDVNRYGEPQQDDKPYYSPYYFQRPASYSNTHRYVPYNDPHARDHSARDSHRNRNYLYSEAHEHSIYTLPHTHARRTPLHGRSTVTQRPSRISKHNCMMTVNRKYSTRRINNVVPYGLNYSGISEPTQYSTNPYTQVTSYRSY